MSTLEKIQEQKFSLSPTNLAEAMNFAKMISDSDLAPKDYKGKPGNTLVAMQMGFELGLQPMQALQNIAVINGRPSVWGDAALALILVSPLCEDIIETKIKDGYSCTAIRKGQEPRTYTFTIEDAKRAGLWGKQGPWSSYPDRMLQMRARGFALRDKFADILKGLILTEEAMDIPLSSEKFMGDVQENNPNASRTELLKSKLIQSKKSSHTIDNIGMPLDISDAAELTEEVICEIITSATSTTDLTNAAELAAKLQDPQAKDRLREAFKAKKADLINKKSSSNEDELPELHN